MGIKEIIIQGGFHLSETIALSALTNIHLAQSVLSCATLVARRLHMNELQKQLQLLLPEHRIEDKS